MDKVGSGDRRQAWRWPMGFQHSYEGEGEGESLREVGKGVELIHINAPPEILDIFEENLR